MSADRFLVPPSLLAPASAYPLGKLDYRVLARMLDRAVMLATDTQRIDEAWGSLTTATDHVGILLDAQLPPASLPLLDIILDRLLRVGVRPGHIIIWADEEISLFRAGLQVVRQEDEIRALGASSEGYRGGVTRIVNDYCDVIINLARLRPDSRVGVWGVLANELACVPEDQRRALLAEPQQLPSVAAQPSARRKFRLHILDALVPAYQPGPQHMPPYWPCGKLLAGRDPVAVDTLGRGLLEEKRAQVKGAPWPLEPAPDYIRTASTVYRLGQADPAKITVLDNSLSAPPKAP